MGVHGHGQARATVSDRLRAQGSLLVGREDEMARTRTILRTEDGPVALHVHGPGGVGKTAFLREVDRLAQEMERSTRWVDATDLASPQDLLANLGVEGTVGVLEALPPRTVVLIDHLEALGLAERWFWRVLAPALPADCTMVVGSRRPPQHLEPRLKPLVEVLPLRNLPTVAAVHLLRVHGIPESVDVTHLVADTHGHPLALVIAADAWSALEKGPEVADPATLLHHPDPAARLLGRFVDDVDDPVRRDALHVAAHVRRLDRAILRHALGVDSVTADGLLTWLRERPYATLHPDGLALHDVVRDVLDQDLRWRDQEAYEQLHGRVREVLVRRLREGPEASRARAGAEILFLHRGNPATRAMYDYETLGSHSARPARAQDRDTVVETFSRVEGRIRGDVAGRLLDTVPGAVMVLEDGTGAPIGVGLIAPLDDPAVRAGDPVAETAWALLTQRREPTAGERVLLQVIADADHPHNLRTVTDLAAALSMAAWCAPGLGWVVFATRHTQELGPVWAYVGFEELGTVPLDDGTVSVWGRDFLRSPFETWLEEMGRRELDATGTLPGPVAAPVAWSREDFAEHVRALLRDLHRPDQVAASPLVRSELVRPATDTSPAEQLREAVVEAVARAEEDPATERAARAVDRTYLRRASTQEAAAEVLGMPFSTYRRHLARGVEAVIERLWSWEVRGGRRVDGD